LVAQQDVLDRQILARTYPGEDGVTSSQATSSTSSASLIRAARED